MDDQRDANRQGGEQGSGGGQAASKGINPVQHSERGSDQPQAASKGINPVQHSEGRQSGGDDDPGREGNTGGNG